MPGICDFELRQMEVQDPVWAKPYIESKHSLLKDFKAVEGVLATSEADKKMPGSNIDITSTLLNSEYSPYGCDETVTTLGIKYWGYQAGSTPSLEEMVIQYLPIPLQARFRCMLPWDQPAAVLEKLADLGLLRRDILAVFRALGIESLDLTPSLARDLVNPSKNKPGSVLKAFKLPHSFQTLKTLLLRKVALSNDDLQSLTNLKLIKLDLASTGISTEATAHLVALKHTLEELNLSNNPKIKHWACYNLAALYHLTVLNLAGTQMRMVSLRYLCETWKSSRNLDLTVPTPCRAFLSSLHETYHMVIPAPYLAKYDKDKFAELYVNQIRNNLAFHQQKDPSISFKGDPSDQLERLKKHLKRREADLRLRKWVLKEAQLPNMVEDED